MVTLTGTGGCGKTRLACEVAEQIVADFPDGIWFIDLASVESADLIDRQLMKSLELTEVQGIETMEIIEEHLQNKKVLLLLDNCEHLLGSCAGIAGRLIEISPDISLVSTSREALNIDDEQVWSVPSLSLADPAVTDCDELSESSEAVRLFADRARLNNPGFELVKKNAAAISAICHRVDGLPLAIELVASQTKYMDTMTILDRLSNRFEKIPSPDPGISGRHQTIQAAIDWSYSLLSEDEKTLFRRLGVFSGGFDLMTVEEVCTNEILLRESIIDLLAQLVDKSMIQTVYQPGEQMRYSLLETMHSFASGKIMKLGEEQDIRKKHLEYFRTIAEKSYIERVTFQEKWITVLQKEHDNMLGALQWAELYDPDSYAALAGSLSWFWSANSHYATALRFLEKVVTDKIGNRNARARAITGYGILLSTGGDLQRALQLLHRALSLWRALEDRKEEIFVLEQLSYAIMYGGDDDDSSVKYAKEALTLAKQLEDPETELHSAFALSQSLILLKKTGESRAEINNIRALAEKMKSQYGLMGVHHLLGDCAILEEQYIQSEREYGKSMLLAYKLGDTLQACIEIFFVAMSVAGQGQHAKALRLNAAATGIAKKNEFIVPEESEVTFVTELAHQHIVGTRHKVGELFTMKYEEEGRTMSLAEAVEYALDVETE
jgi:non-specific serine/threonine protein kinase